ncbi:MAG TPA: hypothetical protein VKQ27_19810, partial [Acetobacteraceae bacterium]|nr:hypothetical protein [Acetobacteraceae bacterium]
ECITLPHSAEARYAVEVGRVAFRTPMLLGGQAARAGLACESCHRNGRTNPVFSFPGLSGAPGTADVTSALFSTRRDDGIDNPRPIPDLGGDKHRLRIDQSTASGALPAFIHGLVVDEFDGHEPPAAVLAGLAAYVRAMDPASCAHKDAVPVTAEGLITEAGRAVRAAVMALDHNDPATAILMVEGARWQLGLIDERYALPGLEPQRALIRSAALDLTAALAAIRIDGHSARDQLTAWQARMPAWEKAIKDREAASLFEPSVIMAHLATNTGAP